MTQSGHDARARGCHEPDAPADESEAAEVLSAVRAVSAGDHEAFARIVGWYQGRLFALILMTLRDPAGAEEVTQDAFVRAFTRLDLYDRRRPFYPWLATIGVRLAQTWLRRHARRTLRERPFDPDLDVRSARPDPLASLIADEKGRRLWRSVESLSSGERTAVFLYYRQEMKVGEIASVLGVTAGTVKTFLSRARRKLHRKIEEPVRAFPFGEGEEFA